MDEATRWRRVQSLSELVEPLAIEDRVNRLRELEPDATIRQEVLEFIEALAAEHRQQRVYQVRPASSDRSDSLPAAIGGVRIEAYIGAGGSGEVFRGVRTANGIDQKVAVKLFHTHRATTDDLTRFEREQQALATLTHPSIVRFFDAGTTEDGRPYLVMELAEGRSIIEYCDDRALRVPARLRLFLRVCEGVESAHRRGILHLDLKPSNVIVAGDDPEAYVKLVDFGTAKLADSAHQVTRTEALTVQYASPERLRGEALSASCDVYSLGLILFELLSGGWPFRRPESVVAVAERAAGVACTYSMVQQVTPRAAEQRAVDVNQLRELLHGDLAAIVSRATAHEPARRYASVGEMVSDIGRYLDGQRVAGQVVQEESKMSRWVKRHPWRVGTAAIAVLTVAAVVTYSATGTDTEVPQQIRPVAPGGEDAHTSMQFPDGPGPAVFDDFVSVSGAQITGVNWVGIYCSPTELLTKPPSPTATGFDISFHNDAGGNPETGSHVFKETIPIARVKQTLDNMRMARCGRPEPTAYGFFSYSASFSAPFTARAGTRYWLSVRARANGRAGTKGFVFWGWNSGAGDNKSSIQFSPAGASTLLPRDRAFTLVRK